MNRQKTIRTIHEVIGISDPLIDLVGRVLDLESDKEMVDAVELHYGTIDHNRLSADVLLHNDFNFLTQFRDYLKQRGLPSEKEYSGRNERDGYFFLIYEGMRCRFFKPDYSPKQKTEGKK